MQEVRFANLSVKDIKIPERFIRKSVFVDDDFVNFIKERGVLQPIGVREIAPGYYELVYGDRRYLGTVKAGLETIPSTIMDLDDRQTREIMLVENEARLDPNPMDIAEHIEGMVQDYGYLEKEIAAMIDKSEPYVSNVLRVFREPFLREMVRSGKITFSAALELLTIRPDPLTEPSEYQNWKTFGAKSSEMGGSKAIRRKRQGKSVRLGRNR
jgi:ParB/RepB/Spo0J family partition protein